MDEYYIVKKSNSFVLNGRYDLSLEEQKIILTLASVVSPDDEDFKSYRFNISEFMNLVGIKSKTKYEDIPKITESLMKKIIKIYENGELIQTAWLCSARHGKGYVELKFSQELKPYMLQLQTMFTQYKLGNILMMKSKYSIRIYELLKCNEYKHKLEIKIDDLRALLKLENSYNRFYDFRKKVLLYSQREINRFTDINFEFTEVKQGKKIYKIIFNIYQKNPVGEKKTEQDIDQDELIDKLAEFIREPLKMKEYRAILEAADYNVMLIREKYEMSKTQEIKNLAGWLLDAIKNDYSKPVESKRKTSAKTNSFTNFRQREYDFEELEKTLLK